MHGAASNRGGGGVAAQASPGSAAAFPGNGVACPLFTLGSLRGARKLVSAMSSCRASVWGPLDALAASAVKIKMSTFGCFVCSLFCLAGEGVYRGDSKQGAGELVRGQNN